MKKTFALLPFICLVTLLLVQHVAEAAPYKNNNFPTDQQIQKTFENKEFFVRSVGKYKDSQGTYHYYVEGKKPFGGGVIMIYHFTVFRLDNGLWLITGPEGYSDVIQE
jgi:hypothetical protein